MLPAPVTAFIAAQGWGTVSGSQAVAGGCINDGRVLQTTSRLRLFFKHNSSAPPDMFQREADGLAALSAAPGAPRVPAAWLWGDDFILLEYLSPAPQAVDYWPELGRRLAQIHETTAKSFGFYHGNYLGTTPQPNGWLADGYAFFAKRRIGFQAARAHRQGLLSLDNLRRAEQLASKLPNLVPYQPASLLHGDLWLGNIVPGPDGQACLIDPAAHFGWAEADLAMTALFGRPPESFYAAYSAERPLAPGYQDRFDLYNLYHLLNHLNLFGASYLPAVETILARYG
jgi:protein-ribulosamine 3-kinase